MSTALGYLDPARHRLNLTIRPNVLATRILFDGNRASGVEVESGEERYVVEGDNIIVSAGAVASPQLLMLSGVGPADHLRGLGYQFHGDKPRIELAFRYPATGSHTRNDVIIYPVSFHPVDAEISQVQGVRLSCILELAEGAGESKSPPQTYTFSPTWTTATWPSPGTESGCVSRSGYA